MSRILTFDLIPSTMWGQNFRSQKSKVLWEKLRSLIMTNKCSVCGSTVGPFHCHEKWLYIVIEGIHYQKLVGVECCCVDCHDIHHVGRTNAIASKSRIEILKQHYCRVNSCTIIDYLSDKREAFEVWRERSRFYWRIDLSWGLETINERK